MHRLAGWKEPRVGDGHPTGRRNETGNGLGTVPVAAATQISRAIVFARVPVRSRITNNS